MRIPTVGTACKYQRVYQSWQLCSKFHWLERADKAHDEHELLGAEFVGRLAKVLTELVCVIGVGVDGGVGKVA